MPLDCKILTSGQIFSLADLTSAGQIVNHEVNLFLVRRESSGAWGGRIFLTTVRAGGILQPTSPIYLGDRCYQLAAVPVGEVALQVAVGNAEQWLEFLLEASETELPINFKPENMAELLQKIVEYDQQKRLNRQKLDQRNRSLTYHNLNQELNSLGKMANLPLITSADSASPQDKDLLWTAIREIATLYHLPLVRETEFFRDQTTDTRTRLLNFFAAANWRVRTVELTQDYYLQSTSPVLVFRRDNHLPAILFLNSNGSFCQDWSLSNKKIPLNRHNAADYERQAYCFYEPFPAGKMTKKAVCKFVFTHATPILWMILLVGLLASGIGFIMPIATQYVTGEIIPTANIPELAQLLVLLLVLTTGQIVIGIVPSLIMMLFNTRQYERFQAAIYDRLLRVPISIFRNCNSGDMTSRIMGASQIQQAIFDIITGQFTSSLFSLVSLAMMFYYSVPLATAGLLMVLVYALVFFGLSRLNLTPLVRHTAASGRLSGLMKQFFDGMAKIRGAGAEQRVLVRFMEDFSEVVKQKFIMDRNGAFQGIFSALFPMLISLVFYAMAGGFLEKNLPLPIFLAFISAFQTFQGGLLGVASGCWSLLAIKPEFDRIMPILEAEPEDGAERHNPGKLDGELEVSHLNFRYATDSPLVLKDVSLHAAPGEFIAIVGPSGAGKSSLIRLLLGFDNPETGAIYYSGRDLANLELRAVRRQLGVILQNSQIMPNSILENIITGTECTVDEAWHALELAALADEVEAMPMGIHTLVTPETISGGQQQRILIARALIGKPAIIIMDESTSALDNIAQDTVKSNLEALHTTRVVIAHRLSTILRADRIYVLDQGQVVQQGTYSELMAQDGLFKQLASRQLTDKLSM